MITSLTFVTGNIHKVEETKKYCPISLKHVSLDLTEIQSLIPEEIVEHKAKEAYKQLQEPILIEDTSVIFTALGKLPGTLIKWFYEELGNAGLCQILNAYTDRSAILQVSYGLYDGEKLKVFQGIVEGSIAKTPKGDAWGWNPVFIPQGYTKTFAEMTSQELKETSVREIALKKLHIYLSAQK